MTEPTESGRCPHCRGSGTVRFSDSAGDWDYCKCEQGRRRYEQYKQHAAERAQARVEAFHQSLPEEFAWLDVRDFPFSTEAQRRVQRDLRAWVAHVPYGPAPWLLLTGPNGVGKTGLACSLTAWLIEHEQVAMARYVVVGDLIDGLHATQRGVKNGIDALFEDLEKVDLLILDEVGEYSAVNWTVERVCRLINQRHAKHLPTIFCTNLSMGGLKGHLGERTMHRILHLSKIVSLQDCPDLRTPPNLPVKIAAVSTASGDAEADNVVPLKAEQRTTGRRTSKRAGTTGATG